MILKNNGNNFINVNVHIGNRVEIERLSPQESRNIASLNDLRQIMNQNLVKSGLVSLIEDKAVLEVKKTDFVLEVKKAIEKTNEYLKQEKE